MTIVTTNPTIPSGCPGLQRWETKKNKKKSKILKTFFFLVVGEVDCVLDKVVFFFFLNKTSFFLCR